MLVVFALKFLPKDELGSANGVGFSEVLRRRSSYL